MNRTSDDNTSLALMSEASRMLVEASTIQQAKELKDLALTAADWARRKGMGDEAIQYARSYALRAERKMGEMLKATDRAVGGGDTSTGYRHVPVQEQPTLSELGVTKRESSEAQFLADLPEEKFEEVATGHKTVAEVKRDSKHPHVSHNSGNNEWYTPSEFIDAARTVMGGIDLDPASSEQANGIVGASEFYTQESDGLMQKWHGRVWMNPPYAQDLIKRFSEKLLSELQNIEQAIVLVNNATETEWFRRMLGALSAVCFPTHRIKFMDLNGEANGAPLQGQAVLYLGMRADRFVTNFQQFGTVLFAKR